MSAGKVSGTEDFLHSEGDERHMAYNALSFFFCSIKQAIHVKRIQYNCDHCTVHCSNLVLKNMKAFGCP